VSAYRGGRAVGTRINLESLHAALDSAVAVALGRVKDVAIHRVNRVGTFGHLDALVAVVRAQLVVDVAVGHWNDAVDSRCHEAVEATDDEMRAARDGLEKAMAPFRAVKP